MRIKYSLMNEDGGMGGTGGSDTLSEAGFSDADLADISNSIFDKDVEVNNDFNSDNEEANDEKDADESESNEATEEQGATDEKDGQQSAATTGKYQAPNTWTKESAAKWATIPEDIQAEIVKRESDFHAGIENYKAAASLGNSFHNIAKDYHSDLQARGVDTLQMVHGVLAMEQILAKGTNEEKLQVFAKLAQDYGILFNEAGDYSFQDSTVKELKDEIALLKQTQQRNSQQADAEKQAKISNEIATFQNDPANKYFNEVQQTMANLIRNGTAKGLKDAYEQAIWLDPRIRQLEVDRIAKEKIDAEAKQKAEELKKAKKLTSVNLSSNRNNGISKNQPKGSWEENLDKEFDRLMNQ